MAYAEKHGRGWRARWRDADGSLRSASGFASRGAAEGYGRDREAGLRVYSFTRSQLIGALSRSGYRRSIPAGPMADAIIEALDGETRAAGG
jgi:hypothetical protein